MRVGTKLIVALGTALRESVNAAEIRDAADNMAALAAIKLLENMDAE